MLRNRNSFDRNSFDRNSFSRRRRRQERPPNDMLQNKNSFGETWKKLQLSKLNESKFCEQVQKEAEERAAIEHAAGEAHFQQEAEERAVAEQADQERLAREAAGPVQLQPGEEDRAAVGTAAEEMRTPRPVTQLDFTPFMSSKGEGAHSTIDPASTERATNVADPALEVESRKAVERTTGSTRLEGPVSQTRQGKLRKPGVIPKASERGVSPQGTARKAAAERSLKTDNRLQGLQPDSGLQGASRLEDVSTGARTVTIIFKAREKGKWVDTYEMTINPSEPSDRSMVERMAKKDARNRQATFYDKDLKLIAPTQCLDAAIEDGTNTVLMAFGGELNVDEEMVASVSQDTDSERKQERKTKRRA
ncbi:hypothetical protein GX51_06546 [Blastomyces parvus]|uniref:Uncharacterized protein n=1 Tax=Blastomyces parvus TaxID=2060905 RepID=A0A2B7WQQ0_9EURO|nr:hypothetical protein GX51_06546 [Blastomyces parvus]